MGVKYAELLHTIAVGNRCLTKGEQMIDTNGMAINIDLKRENEADWYYENRYKELEEQGNDVFKKECYAEWEKGLHKGDIWKR